jgi:hypothetical protein
MRCYSTVPLYKGTFRLAFACAIGSTGSTSFHHETAGSVVAGNVLRRSRCSHAALRNGLVDIDRFTAHACAYAAARTRNRFDHDAVHCRMHSAYPMLTITKFPATKIEFVGTIRICGLPTLFALEDGAFVSG